MRETATAQIGLGEDGILVVRIRQGAVQRPRDARENLDAAIAEGAGRRRPILVNIVGTAPLDAETRHLYSGEALNNSFTALAMVIEASPLGMMMGNVYLRVARPGIPTQLFTDQTLAFDWLRGYFE